MTQPLGRLDIADRVLASPLEHELAARGHDRLRELLDSEIELWRRHLWQRLPQPLVAQEHELAAQSRASRSVADGAQQVLISAKELRQTTKVENEQRTIDRVEGALEHGA